MFFTPKKYFPIMAAASLGAVVLLLGADAGTLKALDLDGQNRGGEDEETLPPSNRRTFPSGIKSTTD